MSHIISDDIAKSLAIERYHTIIMIFEAPRKRMLLTTAELIVSQLIPFKCIKLYLKVWKITK